MIPINSFAKELLQSKLEVAGVFRVILPANHTYGDVNIKKAGFLYVVRGESEFVCDGVPYLLKAGDVLHGMKNMHLKYRTGTDSEFDYYLINYSLMDYKYHSSSLLHQSFVLNTGLNPDTLAKLAALHSLSMDPGSMSSLGVYASFFQLLHDTLVDFRLQSERNSRSDMIEESKAFLHAHYMEPLTLTMLADRYSVSNGFFSAQFRKHTGISPIDYLLQFRINRAKEMLVTKKYTVREIAKKVGYTDAYYFSRLFKKYTGVAPSHIIDNGLS
ncbi:AraC family transcriptional regulator [Paenibacillus sp. YIM B09110]|uniref:AraC family transcriptional regulator n=1 Tax=Paenibacillus sp. YIM B09110 TaxID=3126102 RepID=UPI00301CF01D